MQYLNDTELSSHEGTRCQFNGGSCAIKLGIDVHQDFYVVVMQEGGGNPKPPQRFAKQAFLHWSAKLKSQAREMFAVYEACGFGFSLQRKLSALSINCHVVCPQKLDEQNKRVKTDGLDAKALCLKLDRFVQGNRDALALVRVPSEKEEATANSPSAARAVGQSAQTIGSPGTQSNGQSRLGAGAELVEAAHFWCARCAPVDERAALQQSSDPAGIAAENRCAHRATAKRRRSKTTTRLGKNDQRRDRPRDR